MPASYASAHGAAFRYDGWRSAEEWLLALRWAEPTFSLRRYGFSTVREMLEAAPYVLTKSAVDGDPTGAYYPLSDGKIADSVKTFMAPASPGTSSIPVLPPEPCFRLMSVATVASDEMVMRFVVSLVQLATDPTVRQQLGSKLSAPPPHGGAYVGDVTEVFTRWGNDSEMEALCGSSTRRVGQRDVGVVNNALSKRATHKMWEALMAACEVALPHIVDATPDGTDFGRQLKYFTAPDDVNDTHKMETIVLGLLMRVLPGMSVSTAREASADGGGDDEVWIDQTAMAEVAARSAWLRDVLAAVYATAWSGVSSEPTDDWPAPPSQKPTNKGKTARTGRNDSVAPLQSETVPVLTTLSDGVPIEALAWVEKGCLTNDMLAASYRIDADGAFLLCPLHFDVPRMYGLKPGDVEGLYRLCFGSTAVAVRDLDDGAGPRLFLDQSVVPRWPRRSLTQFQWPLKSARPSSAPRSLSGTPAPREEPTPAQAPAATPLPFVPHVDESVELMMIMAVGLIMASQPYLPQERPLCRVASDYGGVWFTATWVPLEALESCLRKCYPFMEESDYYGYHSLSALLAVLPYIGVESRVVASSQDDASVSAPNAKATGGKRRGQGAQPQKRAPQPLMAQHVHWAYPLSTNFTSYFVRRYNTRLVAWSYDFRQDLGALLADLPLDHMPDFTAMKPIFDKYIKTLRLHPFDPLEPEETCKILAFVPYIKVALAHKTDPSSKALPPQLATRPPMAKLCRTGFGTGCRDMTPYRLTEPYTVRAVVAAMDALSLALDAHGIHRERRGWLPMTAVEDILLFVFPRMGRRDAIGTPLESITTRLSQIFQVIDDMWISHRFGAVLSWPAALARYAPTELEIHPLYDGVRVAVDFAYLVEHGTRKASGTGPQPVLTDKAKEMQLIKSLAVLIVFNYCLLYPEEPGMSLETLQLGLRCWSRGCLPPAPLRHFLEETPLLLTKTVKTVTERGVQSTFYATVRSGNAMGIMHRQLPTDSVVEVETEEMYQWHSLYSPRRQEINDNHGFDPAKTEKNNLT